jgi:hypothetical protein
MSKNWLWFIDNPVHAGHTAKGKFRVYGEGSISHPSLADCTKHCGFTKSRAKKRHPHIVRTDYDSRWAYYRSEIATWLWLRSFRHARGNPETHQMEFPKTVRPVWRVLFGDRPFERYPRVYAAITPAESIYGDRDV